jgi:hypothetical protein
VKGQLCNGIQILKLLNGLFPLDAGYLLLEVGVGYPFPSNKTSLSRWAKSVFMVVCFIIGY